MSASIRATVTETDGSIKIMLKTSWHDLTLWMAEHHGEYVAVDACEIKPERSAAQ